MVVIKMKINYLLNMTLFGVKKKQPKIIVKPLNLLKQQKLIKTTKKLLVFITQLVIFIAVMVVIKIAKFLPINIINCGQLNMLMSYLIKLKNQPIMQQPDQITVKQQRLLLHYQENTQITITAQHLLKKKLVQAIYMSITNPMIVVKTIG